MPSTTETAVETAATMSDTRMAEVITSLLSASPYHASEKPPQMLTRDDALKEKITSTTMGTYRKAKTTQAQAASHRRVRCPSPVSTTPVITPPPLLGHGGLHPGLDTSRRRRS